MQRSSKTTFFLILALCIPVLGYGLMHAITYILPLSQDNILTHVVFFTLIVGLGLTVPYVMMKTAMHHAHINDPREDELEIKHIAKDKEQLAKAHHHPVQ